MTKFNDDGRRCRLRWCDYKKTRKKTYPSKLH